MGAPTASQIELQLNITDTNFARLRWLVTKASKKVANQVVFERRPGGVVVSTTSQYPDIRVFAYLDASVFAGSFLQQRVGVGIKLIESAIRGSESLVVEAGPECQSTFNHLVGLNSDVSWFVADRERTGEAVPYPPHTPPRLAHVTDWKDLVKLGAPFLALTGEKSQVLRTMRLQGNMAWVTDGSRAMSLDRSGPWMNGFVHGAVLKLEPRHPAMWLGWDESTNVGVAFREQAHVTGYAWEACSDWKHPSVEKVLESARNRDGCVVLDCATVASIAAKLKGWSKKPRILLGRPEIIVGDWSSSKRGENKPDAVFSETFEHTLKSPLTLDLMFLAELCAASGTDKIELRADKKDQTLSVYACGITGKTCWEHVLMPCASPKKDEVK